jgi:hypothetical protein
MESESAPVSDPEPTGPDDERVEVDDPFEIPPEVEQAWDDEDAQEGPAPTG